MVDLHVHTYMSDGQYSPEEVIDIAAVKGVRLISITDHDTVDGLAEGEMAAIRAGIHFIPGIEISVTDNRELHILGYYVDRSNNALLSLSEEFARQRDERELRIYDWLAGKEILLSREQVRKYVRGRVVSRTHFARALIETGQAKDFADAFDRYLSTPEFRQIDRPRVSPEYGIKLIREAGGAAVMAHPSSLKLDYEALDAMVEKLAGLGLAGMECYYSTYGKEETEMYISIANNHGLLITGGSDFHGESVKKNIEIGTGINGSLDFSDTDIERKLQEARG